jgi:hypothetical protein
MIYSEASKQDLLITTTITYRLECEGNEGHLNYQYSGTNIFFVDFNISKESLGISVI